VAASFKLEGNMIPRQVKRMFDERSEVREDAESATAVMEHEGRRHVVRLVNVSRSGAMVIFPAMPHIGDKIRLQLLGRSQQSGSIRWVRDGRIGITFDEPLE
jgi:PilZ domain